MFTLGTKNMPKDRNQSGISLIIIVFSIVTLLGFAALAIDLGNMFNVKNELDKATSSATLIGATAYNKFDTPVNNQKNMRIATEQGFLLGTVFSNNVIAPQIVGGLGGVEVDPYSGAVRIKSAAFAQTIFLKLLGINNLQVVSRAAAINFPNSYNVIDTPTSKSMLSFSESTDPYSSTLYSYNAGPGGKVQVQGRLPIIDGPGSEITIIEAGDLDGYYVFVSENSTGPWINITSTGASLVPGSVGVVTDPIYGNRIYGSGTFDIGKLGINYTRFVAIVDDGETNGFASSDLATFNLDIDAIETPIAGMIGPGIDIDSLIINKHSISVSYNDLGIDLNGNDRIDVYDRLIGKYKSPGLTITGKI